MWAIGFVSGVNALTSTDFLKGRDMSGLIDRFRDVCLDSPNKTVLVVARDMVARLRSEAGQPGSAAAQGRLPTQDEIIARNS